ncbi:uncharacterized protein LOC128440700 [Pleuronectes platessa]|uniref:uncharacterized protein LOC128440700 n=1 Tax=Pleuronectes platessa TaxID=8262 RepID=UPI00232A5CDC|nr:uncharacterized protein LOC128440700 [Pleuronectes platessa]XP_053279476.1 uncharacterized protein LOC128440700 [Pleuronectes platessa]XP_053279477.1 uncharacterized protein LOC128440700 [Pleuronectes platessa]
MDKWESTVYVVVKRAGTLPVYTIRPENRDGPLRTLHRDLLLPCGYLIPETSNEPDKQSQRCRPATRLSPAADVEQFSEEDEDGTCWFSEFPSAEISRFSAVNNVPVQSGPVMSEVQDTPHAEPSEYYFPVETPVTSQDTEPISETAHLNDLPGVVPSPETLALSNDNDNEHLLLDGIPPVELLTERVVSLSDCHDLSSESPPVITNLSDTIGGKGQAETDLVDKPRILEPCDKESENQSQPCSDNQPSSARRSVRNRQQPSRLQYVKPGNPLIAVVQSLFQGLTTAFTDVLSETEHFHSGQSHQAVIAQPLPCNGTCMSLGGEDVAHIIKPVSTY